ncbi:MAG: alpha/beta fold hydrolase [Chloroflexota bacterium]|nr:alpha/beta fold hydrolase [Chloroflexota bacterium]
MALLHATSSPASSDRPPVVLVHGAANSSAVWRHWQEALVDRGWSSHALDLRGHGRSEGSVDGATMSDYADDVAAFVETLRETPVLMGWSMGGLIALMVAARGHARSCVALAPSAPADRRDGGVEIRRGVFGPEEYGITGDDLGDQPTMPDLDIEERAIAIESLSPESRAARDDRKAGIVIESLRCPLLVVTGGEDRDWPRSAYDGMRLPADYIEVADASHWGLVLNGRVVPGMADRVTDWLDASVA